MQRSNAEKLTLELTLSGPEDVAIDLHQQKKWREGKPFWQASKTWRTCTKVEMQLNEYWKSGKVSFGNSLLVEQIYVTRRSCAIHLAVEQLTSHKYRPISCNQYASSWCIRWYSIPVLWVQRSTGHASLTNARPRYSRLYLHLSTFQRRRIVIGLHVSTWS